MRRMDMKKVDTLDESMMEQAHWNDSAETVPPSMAVLPPDILAQLSIRYRNLEMKTQLMDVQFITDGWMRSAGNDDMNRCY